MTSDFKSEVVMQSKLRTRSEKSQNKAKQCRTANNFYIVQEIDVAESISSDRFTTGSTVNALTAHVQTLLSCFEQATLDSLRVRLSVISAQSCQRLRSLICCSDIT